MPGDNLNTAKTSVNTFKIEKTVEIKEEKPKIKVNNEPKIEQVVKTENQLKNEPSNEKIKEPKIKSEDKIRLLNSIFNGIESLIKEMYDSVFSKNTQFKPTFSETIYNALLYLGFKAKSVNCLNDFNLAFNGVNLDKISTSFVPYVIKLSTWYDKKFNTDITNKVVSEIVEFLMVLVDNDVSVQINEILNFIKAQ